MEYPRVQYQGNFRFIQNQNLLHDIDKAIQNKHLKCCSPQYLGEYVSNGSHGRSQHTKLSGSRLQFQI